MSESPWEVTVNSKWCKKCGLCIAVCPKKVFDSDGGGPLVSRPADCIGCLQCEMHCPDFAIRVERRVAK